MNNLRLLRKKHNLSLKQLGEKIGVAESTVSLYETGKRQPDQNTLLKIGEVFNVTIDYLLGRTDIPTSEEKSLDEQLEGVEFALWGEVKDLTDGEKQDILDYIRFKKQKGAEK